MFFASCINKLPLNISEIQQLFFFFTTYTTATANNLRSHLCNMRPTPAISHWERQMDGTTFSNVIPQFLSALWFNEKQNFWDLTEAGRAVFAFMSQGNKTHILLHNLSTAAALETVWKQLIRRPDSD